MAAATTRAAVAATTQAAMATTKATSGARLTMPAVAAASDVASAASDVALAASGVASAPVARRSQCQCGPRAGALHLPAVATPGAHARRRSASTALACAARLEAEARRWAMSTQLPAAPAGGWCRTAPRKPYRPQCTWWLLRGLCGESSARRRRVSDRAAGCFAEACSSPAQQSRTRLLWRVEADARNGVRAPRALHLS